MISAKPAAGNCSRQIGAEAVTMPLMKYFAGVGSFLVAALFAANRYFSVRVAHSRPFDAPPGQRINLQIQHGS